MSRLPSSPSDSECENEDNVFQTTYLDELPIRAEDIQQETKHDSVLSKVLPYRDGQIVQTIYLKPLSHTTTGRIS